MVHRGRSTAFGPATLAPLRQAKHVAAGLRACRPRTFLEKRLVADQPEHDPRNRLRLREVREALALGDPGASARDQLAGLGPPLFREPQATQAGRGAQEEQARPLRARRLERRPQVALRRGAAGGARRRPQLSAQAKQLRHPDSVAVALRDGERPVERGRGVARRTAGALTVGGLERFDQEAGAKQGRSIGRYVWLAHLRRAGGNR